MCCWVLAPNLCYWIYENFVNCLDQVTHMHFDFSEDQEKEDKRVEEKKKWHFSKYIYIFYFRGKKRKRLNRARFALIFLRNPDILLFSGFLLEAPLLLHVN